MPKFPFTNYHELNLDWILKKVTALFDASEENAATIRTYNARLTNAEQTATNAETAATAAQQLADAAAENADSALSVAGTADAKADSALTTATDASGAVSGALTAAQEAQQTAGAAVATANDAAATAASLESLANTANQNATAAVETAGTANQNATAAQTAAQTADQKAVTAQQTANSAQAAAATNAGNITTLQTDVSELNRQISVIENGGYVQLPFTYTDGGYIQDSRPGNMVTYTGWKYSDYIDISNNNGTLYCTMVSGSAPTTDGSSYNAFYDANKTYISQLQTINGEVIVPNGAVYVRVSCRNAYTQTLAVVKTGIWDAVENVKSVDNNYIKMVTWNVGIFKDGTNRPTAEEAPAQIIKFLKTIGQCNADIINMQEYAYYVGQNYTYESMHLIDFKYPYELHFPGTGVTKTGSKYATSALEKITFNSGSKRECYYCDINIKGQTITLINAHLSIELDPSTYRDADIAQLITFMNTKERVILSGDFNVASDSEFDAFKTAGYTLCNGGIFGWFDTWPVMANMPDGWSTTWPCNHLDNIIVSSNIVPQFVEAVESAISDHAPLLAVLRID